MRVLHVPLPLSRRGNTLMAVAAELVRCETDAGHVPGVIVSTNRDVALDHADLVPVDYTVPCPRQWFTRSERWRDTLTGRTGLRRRFTGDLYRPAVDAAVAWEPDLVLLYEGLFVAATVPEWRRALPDATLVVYLHSSLARSYGRRELERDLAGVDRVVSVSEYLRRTVVDRVPALSARTAVVPNGVDLATFHHGDGPGTADGGDEAVTLLFVGQVAPHKGPDLLLSALSVATGLTSRPMRALVVGSSDHDAGDELSGFERSLRDLARRDRLDVEFLPFTPKDELAGLYRRASMVCVPSVCDEACPLVVIEAMACGIPVVASRRGALPDMVGDAGVLVDPTDPAAFGAVLARLADDPVERRRMGEAGVARSRGQTWAEADRQLLATGGRH
jgi:glycosyltransferase involved in cell wall biosynthesis